MSTLMAPPDMQRLRRWLLGKGASLQGIQVLDLGAGRRQAIAGRKLHAGSLVMHMPRELLMDVASARHSRTGQALLARHPDASDSALLATHLLDVGRHRGAWIPYCRTLPRAIPEHPLFFSEEQLQALQGSYTLRVIRRHRARQRREHQRLSESQTQGQAFTQEAHALAWATVLTRRFDVRLDGIKTMAMIPFADMPDHALEPNLQWASESSRGFFLTAATDIEAGTPLTIRYWKQCNGLTLATYGFSLETNPHNVAELRFADVPDAEPALGSTQAERVVRDGHRIFTVPARPGDLRVQQMLGYLQGMTGHQDRALALLKQACKNRLEEFPDTAEDDHILLRRPDLPLWLRYAVRVRLDEKTVLRTLGSLQAHQLWTAPTGSAAP